MVDREPVWIDKHAAAKALEQLAGWIKLQDGRIGIAATETGGDAGRHRVEAAMEDPNIAVAVDMHPDDLTPTASVHTLGQGRPAFDKAIGIGQLSRLGVLRRLSVRSCCEARNEEHAGNERRSRSSRRRHNETSLQKALRFDPFGASQWHVPCVSSLGIRHLPGSSRGSLLQLPYTLKSCRFQKWFATNCPAAMVADAADQTPDENRSMSAMPESDGG